MHQRHGWMRRHSSPWVGLILAQLGISPGQKNQLLAAPSCLLYSYQKPQEGLSQPPFVYTLQGTSPTSPHGVLLCVRVHTTEDGFEGILVAPFYRGRRCLLL